jgi:hypothetical protein
MEQNNELQLLESDKHFWEDPINHALLLEKNGDKEYYSIYILSPVFMMSLFDDMEYVKILTQKMIDNGVKVFYDFKKLADFSKEIISRQSPQSGARL